MQRILVVGGREKLMDGIVDTLKDGNDDLDFTRVRNFDEARSVARSTGADILIADVRHSFPASEFDLEIGRAHV